MTTAFDVAGAFLMRAPKNSLPSIKLQKLSFYAFGWYAKVTGSELFNERLCALERGPVVSELLDLHKNRVDFSFHDLACQVPVEPLDDPWAVSVVDAVWSAYGPLDRWVLVDMTHEEDPWTNAWNSPRRGSAKSVTIHKNDVVDYFSTKASGRYTVKGRKVVVPVLALLPDPVSYKLPEGALNAMEGESQEVRTEAFSRMPANLRDLLATV